MGIQINIDKDKLIALIKKHTVQVPFMVCFKRYVCSAVKLLEEIHTCADCDKDMFIEYVNSINGKTYKEREKYNRINEMDILFKNIQQVGAFHIEGHVEAGLGSDPYIVIDKQITKVLHLNFK